MSVASGGSLAEALERVGEGATRLDRAPRFPSESLDALAAAGALALTVPGEAGPREAWATVRAVAGIDGSVARILDGHLNAVERIALLAPEPLRTEHLSAVQRGELRLGVWGADPAPGEGEPARLDPGGETVSGTKVFCSGAGGLDGALALVRGPEPESGPPLLVYVDLEGGVEVDRGWYRAAGMRASESHRVTFDGTHVHALLGEPGALGAEPWFGLDALRTAACWAGLIDAVREEALSGLRERPADDQLAALAAGRLVAIAGTVDAWFERAAGQVERAEREASAGDPERGERAPTRDLSIALRAAVAEAGRATVAQALAALGSRPLAAGGRLDRARRDLEVFLNQHRLDPLLARLGRGALDE